MGRLTNTIEERSDAEPTALCARRGARVRTPTSKLRAVNKYLFNHKELKNSFNPTWDLHPIPPIDGHIRQPLDQRGSFKDIKRNQRCKDTKICLNPKTFKPEKDFTVILK